MFIAALTRDTLPRLRELQSVLYHECLSYSVRNAVVLLTDTWAESITRIRLINSRNNTY